MATVKKPMKKAQSGTSTKKKTGMDAVKAVGKYVSTFGGATEKDNPKQKDINIVKKIKETGTAVKNKLGLKSGGEVAKDGKWIQKAINPKHKGYCTPMTKATCTPKRKALAKTLKAMGRARKAK